MDPASTRDRTKGICIMSTGIHWRGMAKSEMEMRTRSAIEPSPVMGLKRA